MTCRRLPNRRQSESFSLEVGALRYTATVSWFDDGRIAELFCSNHKTGNQADTNARDAGILLSLALQHGADINDIRKALSRDSKGQAPSPVGAALDLLAEEQTP